MMSFIFRELTRSWGNREAPCLRKYTSKSGLWEAAPSNFKGRGCHISARSESCLCGSLVGEAWASYLTSLGLSFLIIRMGPVIAPSSQGGHVMIHAKQLEQTPHREQPHGVRCYYKHSHNNSVKTMSTWGIEGRRAGGGCRNLQVSTWGRWKFR